MGCAGSKSTPVVEANTDVNRNLTSTNGTVMQKIDDIGDSMRDIKENITENIAEKVSEIMNSEEPSTPETERAGDSDATPLEEEVGGNDDAEIVEDENGQTDVDQNPVKLEFNTDNLEESSTATNDKPPTPMPEAVKLNAQWPNVPYESDDTNETNTPLDAIEEEKRFIDVGLPSSDEAAVIEILTIEIAEIPIIDEATLNLENKSFKDQKNDEDDENENENNAENNHETIVDDDNKNRGEE